MIQVIVDTTVWSAILRRKQPEISYQKAFDDIMDNQELILMGPIVQELLSGIPDTIQFKKLSQMMSFFEITNVSISDYLLAAQFFNSCRAKGIQGSHIDFLICAVAHRLNAHIWTLDKDFDSFRKIIPVKLFQV